MPPDSKLIWMKPAKIEDGDPYRPGPLRCGYCGRTHPPCNFYPIAGLTTPNSPWANQICIDCDNFLKAVYATR